MHVAQSFFQIPLWPIHFALFYEIAFVSLNSKDNNRGSWSIVHDEDLSINVYKSPALIVQNEFIKNIPKRHTPPTYSHKWEATM